jgi:hypothetical protein
MLRQVGLGGDVHDEPRLLPMKTPGIAAPQTLPPSARKK